LRHVEGFGSGSKTSCFGGGKKAGYLNTIDNSFLLKLCPMIEKSIMQNSAHGKVCHFQYKNKLNLLIC